MKPTKNLYAARCVSKTKIIKALRCLEDASQAVRRAIAAERQGYVSEIVVKRYERMCNRNQNILLKLLGITPKEWRGTKE